MSNDISLYGNLIADKILMDFQEYTGLGGIANVWHGIKFLNQEIAISMRPTDIGEAIILVDKKNSTRIGRGFLNLSSSKVSPNSSRWHHISYINSITHPEFIKEIKTGIISADITKENPEKCLEYLEYIDYLFIAEEDLFIDLDSLASLTKGWVVCHSPLRSVLSDGEKTIVYNIPKKLLLENVNVLGAGDYFAAAFINCSISGLGVEASVKKAHEDTTKMLKGQ
tara:strand:- start:1783 stop:2457 length:675 start_codon:yes stop_codon:yes gene_type:complete